jgi:hypothetical protein
LILNERPIRRLQVETLRIKAAAGPSQIVVMLFVIFVSNGDEELLPKRQAGSVLEVVGDPWY